MDPDGSDRRRLYESAANDYGRVAPSPDGARLSFSSDRSGQNVVYVLDTRRTITPISDPVAWSFGPSWSSRDRIAYFSRQGGNRLNIWTVSPDGSDRSKSPTGLVRAASRGGHRTAPHWRSRLIMERSVSKCVSRRRTARTGERSPEQVTGSSRSGVRRPASGRLGRARQCRLSNFAYRRGWREGATHPTAGRRQSASRMVARRSQHRIYRRPRQRKCALAVRLPRVKRPFWDRRISWRGCALPSCKVISPGRAGFPHPVLHERGSLTAAYPWRSDRRQWVAGRGERFGGH